VLGEIIALRAVNSARYTIRTIPLIASLPIVVDLIRKLTELNSFIEWTTIREIATTCHFRRLQILCRLYNNIIVLTKISVKKIILYKFI